MSAVDRLGTVATMKLTRISHLFDDPGPFASAYVDVSRDQQDGNRVAELEARHARDELVAQGAPESVADLVRDTLTASTHEGSPVSLFVVATERGVLFSELIHRHRPQPTLVWDSLPDVAGWIEDQSFEVPYVLALVDHEGGNVSTYGTSSQQPEESESMSSPTPYEHTARTGGHSHLNRQLSSEVEWFRNAQDVSAEIDRQVQTGPALVILAGDVHSRQQVEGQLGKIQATVVQLEHGGRNADGGEEALEAAVTEVLRGQAVAANLEQLHTLKRRLNQGQAATSGIAEVAGAFVRGQVDRLFVNPTEAGAHQLAVEDHPGLALGAITAAGPFPADRALIAAAALTDAEVVIERSLTLGDAPVAALLRWDQTAEDTQA